MADPATVWTVGHSTRPLSEFMALLQENSIEVVADVRTLPTSRRHPHFSADALGPSLERSGIAYVHVPEVGGLRKARRDSRNTAWKNDAFRGYADYMETPEFEAGLTRLMGMAGLRGPEGAGGAAPGARAWRVALMCAEADWRKCHRGLLSDALKVRGVRVMHIGKGELEEHPYTKPARVVDGRLTYEGEGLWASDEGR